MEINTASFEGAMQRLRDGVRRGFIDQQYGLLAVQGRLLAERCQTFTPPRNVGQGKAATTRDIMAVYFPLSHTTFKDKGLRRIVAKDDRQAWNVVSPRLSATNGLKNTTAISFDPNRHKQFRNKRGRVNAKYANFGQVTLGPEGRKARRYLKDTLKHVGWARSGWNAGITGLGGTVKAQWVSRHGNAGGSLVDGRNAPDPFVQVINSTGWAKKSNEGTRILKNAIQARIRDMESYYNRMMQKAAESAQRAA